MEDDSRTRRRKRQRRRNRFLPLAIGISGGVAISTVAFWFFHRQATHVVGGHADPYDEMIMDLVHTVDSPPVNRAMQEVTRLGTHSAIAAIAVVGALAARSKNDTNGAWTVLLNAGGAMALSTGLKAIFQRQRPQELARHVRLPKSHSFPSGHSLLTMATFPIAIHQIVQDRSSVVIVASHAATGVVIATVGFSRIYLGVHYPSDVLGGFAAGLGWLGLTSLTHTMIERSRATRLRRARARRLK